MFFNPFDIKSDKNDNIFIQGQKFQIRESQAIKEKIALFLDNNYIFSYNKSNLEILLDILSKNNYNINQLTNDDKLELLELIDNYK